MQQDEFLALFENQFLTFTELSKIPAKDNGERLMSLRSSPIAICVIDDRMRQYTGSDIFVRETVLTKLIDAQKLLAQRSPDALLEVVYCYRHIEIQVEFFEAMRAQILAKKFFETESDLKEEVHHFIAVPEVAGHPTGGAVDVRIIDSTGVAWPMGTKIHDFIKNSYVHSPFIDKLAWQNRQVLRQCMTSVGFAPFDGEWWHFSYGDREWAKYYNQTTAIFDQVAFQSVT